MTLLRSLSPVGTLLLLASAVHAQGPAVRRVTLEQALALAVPASETVGLARAALSRAGGEVRRSRSSMLPQVAGSASYDRLLKSQFEGFASGSGSGSGDPAPEQCDGFTPIPADPISQRLDSLERSVRCLSRANPFSDLGSLPFGRANTWTFGLAASQTLFAGGRLRAGVDAAQAGERSAEIGVTVAEASLTLDVVTAFYDAVLSDRLVTIARAALDQADTTLGQTRLRREVGTAPEFDLLRAGVARDNLRPAVIEAEARREIAHLRLRQLLDLPAGQAIALEATLGPDGYLHGPTLTALLADQADTTGERRAAVRQADAAVTAREALLTVARGETLPTLQLSSQYGRVAYPSAALPDWNEFLTNWTVNLGLQVPLFTGGRLRAGREVAQASLDEATLRRQQAVEGAALDARTALAGRDATEAIWRASAGTVDQATRAYQIAEIRYQEGLSTQTELLDARLALQQAEANQAMAARNLAVARVRLALLPDLPLAGATNSTALPSAPPGSALPTTATPSTGPGLP